MADGESTLERKVSVIATTVQNEDIVKIGVSASIPGLHGQSIMLMMNQTSPLAEFIENIKRTWNLDKSHEYSLQFDDTKLTPPPIYITEQNRRSISNGDILKLDFSPSICADLLVNTLSSKGSVSIEELRKLSQLTVDETFATEFSQRGGMTHLKDHLRRERESRCGGRMGHSLSAFLNMMEHGLKSWDEVDKSVLESAIWCLGDMSVSCDEKAVSAALEILETVISESSKGQGWITELNLSVDCFMDHLKKRDPDIQSKCIGLVNTIFSKSDKAKQNAIKKQLLSNRTRNLVNESVFRDRIGPEMGFQLYTLQTHLFNLLKSKMNYVIRDEEAKKAAMKTIEALQRTAFETESGASVSSSPRDSSMARDLSKLGFSDATNPLNDFLTAPPGILTLDCLDFFRDFHMKDFKQIVLENSRERTDEADCPIVRAAVQLTKLLIHVLRIGEPPAERQSMGADGRTYYPLFFTKEKPFEELFSVCLQRFTKTWREMKASLDDFNKVEMVVREQIQRALMVDPAQSAAHILTFDQLKRKLNQLSFSEIQTLRRKELEEREELRTQAKPIRELRESLIPEMKDIIKQQRLNKMLKGGTFKTNKKKAEKYIICKLSPNLKTLQYAYTAESENVPRNLTFKSLNLLDVDPKEEAKCKITLQVKSDVSGEDPISISAFNEDDHDAWLDGLNYLASQPMTSKLARKDLDTLLSLEVKLRLLEAEGVVFPDSPPPIPAPPPNLNFATA